MSIQAAAVPLPFQLPVDALEKAIEDGVSVRVLPCRWEAQVELADSGLVKLACWCPESTCTGPEVAQDLWLTGRLHVCSGSAGGTGEGRPQRSEEELSSVLRGRATGG